MKTYNKYKDSGIEWIGEIPEHWEVRKLKFVATNQPSNIDKKSKEGEDDIFLCNYVDVYKNEFIDDSIQYMKATATDAQIKKFILEKGDVLATKDSEDPSDIAVPALVTKDFENVVCGYHLTMMKPIKDKLVGGFLFRLLQSDSYRSYFEIMANGVTRYGLSTGAFNNLEVVTPSVEEQTQIAQFLDQKTAELDQAIALKEELISLLKEERAALINEAVTKGIDPNVPMKDSGIEWIGEIPEHWEVKRVKYIAFLQRGHDLPKDDFKKGKIPVYGSNGIIGFHDENTTKGPGIVMGRSGSVGKLKFVTEDFWAHNTALFVKKSYNNDWRYLYYMLSMIDIKMVSAGSAVPTLDRKRVHELKRGYPPIKEQNEIVNFIEEKTSQIDQEIKLSQEEINLLKEYRQSLISEAVTGKIDVREYALESVG